MFQDLSTAFQKSDNSKSATSESGVIRYLREELQTENGFSEENFWERFEKDSTPILEAIEGDSDNLFCTFIFKGNAATKSVYVNIPPFSRIKPEDFQMSHIPETNIWFTSVKLPSKCRFAYSLIVDSPYQTVNPQSLKEEIAAFKSASQIDLLNANRLNNSHSYFEMPGVEPLKYLGKKEGRQTGKVEQITLKSEILQNERTVSIYTPPNYKTSESYPALILLDEEIYLHEINAPRILDNLQSEKLIPPMIVVFVGNAPHSREKELACDESFSKFINTELLDRIKSLYGISSKTEETIIGGASFGGLSAVYTGLSYPQTFGKILSQSGSFWRCFDEIAAKINEQRLQNQKFYLDAGIFEFKSERGISLLEANRNLQHILRTKGFEINYQEFRGGHGAINWRSTFADGLIYLTGDSPRHQDLIGNPNLF